MKTKLIVLAICFILFSLGLFGQIRPDSSQLSAIKNITGSLDNSFAIHWQNKNGTADIITFGKPRAFAQDPVVSAQRFLHEIRGVLKQREADDELQTDRIQTSNKVSYVRFKQMYKGIPVNGGEYVVTVLLGGKIQSALGGFFKDIQLDVIPKLSVQQALSFALLNPPPSAVLKDSLDASRLIIHSKDNVYHLAWELRIPELKNFGEWIYIIDASNGEVLDRVSAVINETFAVMQRQPQANVYLHHPYIDASYTFISPFYVDYSGYIQGTYANVVNDATSRAYSSLFDFAYSSNDTHFDEANLYYHIDNFRRNLWNGLGFTAFTQITAHAHTYFSDGPNASYSLSDHQLRFSDGQGVYGYNDFAKEDKVIMHEYTHAVTDYTAHLNNIDNYGRNETNAIHEGNSDYYAGTFTGRTLINEYISPVYTINQRDMANPRIANYTQYGQLSYYQGYPLYEPHFGGELWSASLWDLRSNINIGPAEADYLVYQGLFGIPTNSTFLQYRQAIMNADINYRGSLHIKRIAHSFYLRGIGTDSLGIGPEGLMGPSNLAFKEWGTWTAYPTGGSGNVSYQWYVSDDNGSTWSTLGTAQSQSYRMVLSDFIIRCDVHDNGTGENASERMTVYYSNGIRPIANNNGIEKVKEIPKEYFIGSYPNPFNPAAVINYQLPTDGLVKLSVFDILGREVKTIVNETMSAGYYKATFDGSQLPSGIYLARISITSAQGKSFVQTIKMVLTK